MSTGGKLLRGSIFRTLDLVVFTAAAFAVTPYLVRALGDRQYGFWSLVGTFVGYYGFLDLGLTASATRFMSQALGKGDEREAAAVASTSYYVFAAGAAAVMLAAGATAWAAPRFIAEPGEAEDFRRLVLIMGAAAALGFPNKAYTGLLTAGIRYDAIAAISIVRTVLVNAAVLGCLRAGFGLTGIALASFAVAGLQYAFTGLAARRLFPAVRVTARGFEPSRVGGMASYGANIFVCQVGDILRSRVDTIVIAAYLGAGLVTPYVVGVRLVEGFAQLVRSSVGMMLPVFSQYEGRGDYDAIRSALLRATRVSTILTGFIGLSLLFYGRAFVERWMGPGYGSAFGVAAILCASLLVALPQSPGVQLLYGLSKHKQYAALSVAEGLANVALSILLVKPLGLYGVALGTLVSVAVFKLSVQPLLVCRAAGLPMRVYLVDAILVPLLKTAAPLGLYFLAVAPLVRPDFAVIAGLGALQAAVFAPAAYFLILDEGERALILRREARPWPASARG